MAIYTPNYELKKPAPEDAYNISDFNNNVDKIDEVLASLSTLITNLQSEKVDVDDIVNNLTTNNAKVPLSASQGVAIKTLINSLTTEVGKKVAKSDIVPCTLAEYNALTTAQRAGKLYFCYE